MILNVDPQLSQWDVGRSVSVSDSNATHIHFANQGDSKAVIIEITEGSAKIPDYLLQTGKTVIAYAVLDGVTLDSKSFPVRKRERPENYVYEEDQRNYIYELITNAESAVTDANLATESANNAAASANLASTTAADASVQANLAAKNANEATTKAVNAVKNMMVVGEAKGTGITLDNAIEQYLVGLRIFGKTTQDGTPTPDAPVELVSVGDGGSITVDITGENDAQSMTIATPNGLLGIPVAKDGNYTDENGQQWICDEIDFARGVYVHRLHLKTLDGSEDWKVTTNNAGVQLFYHYDNDAGNIIERNGLSSIGYAPYESIDVGGYGLTYAYHFRLRLENMNPANNTLDELKAYLSTYPIDVLVSREKPIETHLSEEELATYASLHTYKGNTTVSNDAGAWMNLEYVMDAKKYIDSLVTGGIAPARVE